MASAASEPTPLSEPTFFILLSLRVGPRHGYAILKEVAELSGGRVRLSSGTLYGALKRLLEFGWIARVIQDDAPPARVTAIYELTERGAQVLSAEIDRLGAMLRAARTVQGGVQ